LVNPYLNQMLPGSGNSFKDYVDRKMEEEREVDGWTSAINFCASATIMINLPPRDG